MNRLGVSVKASFIRRQLAFMPPPTAPRRMVFLPAARQHHHHHSTPRVIISSRRFLSSYSSYVDGGGDDDYSQSDEGKYDDVIEDSNFSNKELWMRTFEELKSHLQQLRKERRLEDAEFAPTPVDHYLRFWVNKLRHYHQLGRFEDEERIEMLESIGVHMAHNKSLWEFRFQKLQEFLEKNDNMFPYDFEVEKLDDEGLSILRWTRRQKEWYRAYKNGEETTMTEDRIAKLEGIGFSWNKYDSLWMRKYEELVQYYEYHGNSLVPTNYPANQDLAIWVQHQRVQYRAREQGADSSLSDERKALLEKVDFQWDAHDAKWVARYHELAEHVAINGKGSLPSLKSNRLLRYWCNRQKTYYRKLQNGESVPLTTERIEMLDELGFPWPDN